jgi:hypothetical protein
MHLTERACGKKLDVDPLQAPRAQRPTLRRYVEQELLFWNKRYGESCMSDSETTIITVDVKLRVQHKDGHIETLDIAKPVSMLEGAELDRIVCSDGTEHFFTKDGYYDGWGAGAPSVRGDQRKKEP